MKLVLIFLISLNLSAKLICIGKNNNSSETTDKVFELVVNKKDKTIVVENIKFWNVNLDQIEISVSNKSFSEIKESLKVNKFTGDILLTYKVGDVNHQFNGKCSEMEPLF